MPQNKVLDDKLLSREDIYDEIQNRNQNNQLMKIETQTNSPREDLTIFPEDQPKFKV